MKLYSYVVARDYGFAPNPFFGACTLATCKPIIRRKAQIGDWIVGTGSATKGCRDHLVYAMRVAETMSFNDYWSDPRFRAKRPNLRGSIKQAYGDNIYHRHSEDAPWEQEDSRGEQVPLGIYRVAALSVGCGQEEATDCKFGPIKLLEVVE